MCMLKYLVFLKTRMVDNVIQARALIKMQVLQVARILNLPVVDSPDLFPAIQKKLWRLSSKLYNNNTFRTADTHLKFFWNFARTRWKLKIETNNLYEAKEYESDQVATTDVLHLIGWERGVSCFV